MYECQRAIQSSSTTASEYRGWRSKRLHDRHQCRHVVELKFGFGYRYATSSSQTVWPGDQVLADAGDGYAIVTREGLSRLASVL